MAATLKSVAAATLNQGKKNLMLKTFKSSFKFFKFCFSVFEPTSVLCICMVGSYASLSVCLSVRWSGPKMGENNSYLQKSSVVLLKDVFQCIMNSVARISVLYRPMLWGIVANTWPEISIRKNRCTFFFLSLTKNHM